MQSSEKSNGSDQRVSYGSQHKGKAHRDRVVKVARAWNSQSCDKKQGGANECMLVSAQLISPILHSEFQDSEGYPEKPFSNNTSACACACAFVCVMCSGSEFIMVNIFTYFCSFSYKANCVGSHDLWMVFLRSHCSLFHFTLKRHPSASVTGFLL